MTRYGVPRDQPARVVNFAPRGNPDARRKCTTFTAPDSAGVQGDAVMTEPSFIPYRPVRLPEPEMLRRAREFFTLMDQRRSVRHFAPDPVARELIELAIATASTAPSGAHRQPWRFVAVNDPEIKRRIRVAAETEERASYEGRMSEEWLRDLAPLGTDWHKPYLETVPWIVTVFEEVHGLTPDGRPKKNYYVKESVGIACGLFITALHCMGLATLTHTPSPMAFLSRILGRPDNERPYILFPVGYPAEDAQVPNLRRKALDEVAVWDPPPPEQVLPVEGIDDANRAGPAEGHGRPGG